MLPIGAVGYLLWVVKLIAYSRRSGASATVLASFYTRWMQHKLGTRRDEPCGQLMTVLPPMMHQSAGRTTFYDAALQRHLASIEQLVILGTGLDTRVYRLPREVQVRYFEVDTPKTQLFKREMLKKAGVDTTRVTYAPADFLKEDWFEKLVEAGFEPDKPSFFLWESVTMYLDRETVESILRKIAGTTTGTIVAFDYLSVEIIQARSLFARYARVMLNAAGEPWRFGIDNTPPVRDQIAVFLKSCGLSLEEQRNFGQEAGRNRSMAGFATGIVPSCRQPLSTRKADKGCQVRC